MTDGKRVFALVGNPNCGKTTIFNALTGLRQKVSNYPGVTVERKEGVAIGQHGEALRIIDLPGAYSLNAHSPDEEILRDVLLGRLESAPKPDAVICVIDASNAERHLYLATQILELGLPTIIVLNMVDVAASRQIRIDPEKLGEALNVPVIPMQATRRVGLPELRIAMSRLDLPASIHCVYLPDQIHELLDQAFDPSSRIPRHAALYLPGETRSLIEAHEEWEDQLIQSRYDSIRQICSGSVDRSATENRTTTDKLDSIFLHKAGGWVSLTAILGSMFFLIFRFADVPMGWIEALFETVGGVVRDAMPPGDFRDLVTDGVIAGVGGVVIFLPQILILFFFIGLMEDTGYLSRVAFLMDRLMSRVGLHGRSFIPLLSSYACAIPGIMGARTVADPKQRLITILVAPFASCSARLPVYLIMIAVLVPAEKVPALTKAAYLLGLYGLGTFGIFGFAWLFNRIFRRQPHGHSVMELPTYKAPSLKAILMHMWERSWIFIRRAGTIILGISILLWAAETYPKSEGAAPAEQLEQSMAGRLGHAIEPVIRPLGYDWKIGIGLIASFAAREVFVSAMSITFHVEETDDEAETEVLLRDQLRNAKRPDGTPLFTHLTCLSILVFYVFALQCVSTIAVVRRETNSWRWPLFQMAYMTGTAYLAALLVYQGGRLLGFS